MPEQVIRPASRLAFGVDVPATEEIGLHVHLLDVEFAGFYPLPDPLVAGIEPSRVPCHGHQPRLFLHPDQPLGVGQRIGHGDLHLHVLAGAHALFGLVRVHLRGRGKDRGFDPRLLEALGEVRGPVGDSELPGDRFGRIRRAAGEGDDLHAVNPRQSRQVLLSERPLPSHTNLHSGYSFPAGSCARGIRAATRESGKPRIRNASVGVRKSRGCPILLRLDAPVVQLDRTPAYEAGSREFESLRARQSPRGGESLVQPLVHMRTQESFHVVLVMGHRLSGEIAAALV